MSSVSLQIDVLPRHNRLTTFFRYPMVFPIALVNYVYAIAAYVATGDESVLPLPLTPVRPLPFYGVHNAVAAAFIAWYRFLDRHGMA